MHEAYELLDFGAGRKLERFGQFILDRPSPAADGALRQQPEIWDRASARLPAQVPAELQRPWEIHWKLDEESADSELVLELKLTPFGHVGLFPEQYANWQWLFRNIQNRPNLYGKALNLFAYTGAATLAMAAAGAEVVHIDSSAPSVAWARRNSQKSNLDGRPIRWIVEDAFKFVAREIRRRNHYGLIVLDPPSYGHTPTGGAWKLAERWQELLDGCLRLLPSEQPTLLLWTGHGTRPSTDQLADRIDSLLAGRKTRIASGRSQLTTRDGRALDAGYFLRAELYNC